MLVIIFIFAIFGAGTAYLYFSYRSSPNTIVSFTGPENTWLTQTKQSFGIDISHYQGIIDWEKLSESDHDINYIFIRATMGADGKDYQFKNNWDNAKKNNYLRGAYHYYRPNENSELQFKNFSKRVKLSPGDFPPVLILKKWENTALRTW
ncbi:glycoside hydrolase family 25 protein [Salegentibacter sp. HM20]